MRALILILTLILGSCCCKLDCDPKLECEQRPRGNPPPRPQKPTNCTYYTSHTSKKSKTQVPHRQSQRISDSEMKSTICYLLTEFSEEKFIEVKVNNGVAFLTGTIKSEPALLRILGEIERVLGKIEIKLDISVLK
jgi:hypothetical protein